MCGVHEKSKLAVVWTRDDREVADTMILPYLTEAKENKWWRHVALIVWGPSVRLLANDAELLQGITKLAELGVEVKVDAGAAKRFAVEESLQRAGIAVQPLGYGLTDVLADENEEWATLTL